MHTPINLLEHAEALDEYWSPRIVGQLNDQYVKVARLKGTFVWHQHDDEDELFLVLKGTLRLDFRHTSVELEPGDCYIVPRGTPHLPIADDDCCIALIETVTTQHTGERVTPLTRSIEAQYG